MDPTTISDVIESINSAIIRLEYVTEDGSESCREYSLANTKLEEALMWVEKRCAFLKQKNEEEAK